MRKCLLIACFFVFCSFISAARSETGYTKEKFTLDQAIKRALKRNHALLSKEALVEAAIKEKKAEWGRHLPNINLLGEAYRTRYPTAITPIGGIGKFPHFSKDIYLYNLSLELPIYEGGRISKQVKIAELEIKIRESLKRQTIHDLIANIENTFYLAIYLKALVKAQQKVIYALKREYKDASLKLKAQKIAPLDLLRIKTQLKTEEAALKGTKESLKRAKHTIAVLMGDPPHDNFLVLGKLTEEKFLPPEEKDLERFLLSRPDISAAEKRVKKAFEKVSLAWRKHLPSVELFSSYGRKAGSGLHHDEDLWEIGLRLKLNLFSGGTVSAEVEKARAEFFSAQEDLKQKRLEAMKEIKAAISELVETSAQVQRYKTAKETAKEAYRVESLKYRTGAGTVTDMLISQAAWFNAEADYLYALYRYQKAKIAYEYATGKIGEKWIAKR